MKKTFVATLALSLLAGTSALAQEAHQRGDWKDRVAEHRQDQATEKTDGQDQSDHHRPARPVPQVSNERAQEAIAAARTRQAEPDAAAPVRGDVRAEHRDGVIAQVAAQAVARREAAERRSQEQRVVVPRVTPRPDDHRQTDRNHYDRRDNGDQHVIVRGDRDNDRDGDRNRRPGEGHQLRDRDQGRHWYNPDQWRRTYHAQHRYRTQHYRTPPGFYIRSWVFGDVLPGSWYTPNYYLNWWSYGLPRPPIGTEWVRSGDDALLVDTWSGEVLSVYYDLFW
jgi:Ni/Co efflux regulator RcnB